MTFISPFVLKVTVCEDIRPTTRLFDELMPFVGLWKKCPGLLLPEKSTNAYCFSVLVHSGGVTGGHYYAFIRPTLTEQW